MKRILLLVSLLAACLAAHGQDGCQYTDAAAFPLYGKAHQEDGPRYRRLPERLDGVVRQPVWKLGTNSAGLYIRFRSDAPTIYAKWTNTAYHMPHMTDCGVGGLDLYTWLDGKWCFVGSAFDWTAGQTEHTRKIVDNMQPAEREYMLYLSLYDEVKSLELGVPEGYTLEQPVLNKPVPDSPVVMYGTSILQGCSASRPGMAHSNILSRRLDRTVINLGFSGNAFLDDEIAALMADVENPAVYVLDYVPNAKPERIEEKGETFYRILREKHPSTPIVFVEDPIFPHTVVDGKIAAEVTSKNAAQRALFEKLQAAGEKNIYYLPAQGMTQPEDFVDGIHFTDQGMVHYADYLAPLLESLL